MISSLNNIILRGGYYILPTSISYPVGLLIAAVITGLFILKVFKEKGSQAKTNTHK